MQLHMTTVLNFQNSGKIKTDILREFNTPCMPHVTDMSQMLLHYCLGYMYVHLQVLFTASDLKILILDSKECEKVNITDRQAKYTRDLCQSLVILGSGHLGLSLSSWKISLGTT